MTNYDNLFNRLAYADSYFNGLFTYPVSEHTDGKGHFVSVLFSSMIVSSTRKIEGKKIDSRLSPNGLFFIQITIIKK